MRKWWFMKGNFEFEGVGWRISKGMENEGVFGNGIFVSFIYLYK